MRRLALLVFLATVILGCSGDEAEQAAPTTTTTTVRPETTTTVPPLDDDLRVAWETWQERGPTTYRLWTTQVCNCSGYPGWIDLVADGAVTAHIPTATGPFAGETPGPRSMGDLYWLVMDLRAESHEVKVTIDDDSGAIESIGVNPDEFTADDGYGLYFAVEPGETELPHLPADVRPANLTEPFECDRSFGRSDPSTGSAIHIELRSDEIADRTHFLSEKFGEWGILVRTASDEDGIHCDHYGRADPAAHAQAIDGRLTSAFSQDGCHVRVMVTDLTIEGHEGERVNLGDFEWSSNRRGDCFVPD